MNTILSALIVISSLLELMILGFTPGAFVYVLILDLIETVCVVSILRAIN